MTELDLDISVLIATRDRAASLARTLESMAVMDTAGIAWQLFVVDNGSRDRTPELLRQFEHRLPLVWITVTDPGQNRARNVALPSLRGRLTILTDDDVVVAPDWLRQWQEGATRWPQETIFGGTIVPRFPAGTPGWISGPEFPFRAQCFAAFSPALPEGPCPRLPFGPNFAVRTALLRTQPFREDLGPTEGSYAVGGETELTQRLCNLGNRVIYLPGPCVEHVLAVRNLSLERLLQRGFDGGRGDEYRRAMRANWSRSLLLARRHLLLPLKLAFYLLAAALSSSTVGRFRYAYKRQATRGRMRQLDLMLSSAEPAPVAEPSWNRRERAADAG